MLMDFQDEPYRHLPEWMDPTETLELRTFQAEETIHFVLAEPPNCSCGSAPLGTLGKKDDVAVRTNAPGSVFAHSMLFERLWSEGDELGLEP
jgi:hypothetical protein